MKKIKLTKGYQAIVDNEDFDWLNKWKWCAKVGHWGVYAIRRPWNKESKDYNWVYMHREVNKTPKGLFTDHINGNGLDNRKSNLRTVTTQQNAFNTKKYRTNTSGYRGIYYDDSRGKYRVRIGADYKTVHLGSFKLLKDAIKARKEAEKTYHVF